jgi:hypothetical protein
MYKVKKKGGQIMDMIVVSVVLLILAAGVGVTIASNLVVKYRDENLQSWIQESKHV